MILMSDSPNNNCEEALRKDHRNLQEDQALHLEVMLLREKFLTQARLCCMAIFIPAASSSRRSQPK